MEAVEIILISCLLAVVVCCAIVLCYQTYLSCATRQEVGAAQLTLLRLEEQIHAIDHEVLRLSTSLDPTPNNTPASDVSPRSTIDSAEIAVWAENALRHAMADASHSSGIGS